MFNVFNLACRPEAERRVRDEPGYDHCKSASNTTCRVTTCLENLENLQMSGNMKHVREMSGMLLTVRELSGKNVREKNLVMEKCPKTVHY